MTQTRFLRLAGAALLPALCALGLVTTAAAHPGGAGVSAGDQIWDLHRLLLVVAVPIAVLVEALIIYAVFRFRDNDEPTPTTDNRQLEIGWTVATAIVLIFVGVASFQVLAQPAVTPEAGGSPPDDVLPVELTASQWAWSVTYPNANVTVGRVQVIYLPADRPVVMTVTSTDVIHSVHVPALGIKQDALPGQEHTVQTRVAEPGAYHLYCAEYCGAGHSSMRATVKVVPPAEFEAWLEDERSTD